MENHPFKEDFAIFYHYPLVNKHSYWTWPSRNSGFSHQKWWIFPQFCDSLPEGKALIFRGFSSATFVLEGIPKKFRRGKDAALCLPRYLDRKRLNEREDSCFGVVFGGSFLLGSFEFWGDYWWLPSGKPTKDYGTSPLFMEKSTN